MDLISIVLDTFHFNDHFKCDSLGEYEVNQLLGKGAFGSVFCGHTKDMQPKAIKAVALLDFGAYQSALHEAEVLQKLAPHPNIPQVHETFHTLTKYCIVMDLAKGGNLYHEIIRTHECNKPQGLDGGLDETTARSYFSQICKAVQHAHRNNIAHRDIKPENVLISEDKTTVFLSDFGLATSSTNVHSTSGTLDYCAPEVLDPTTSYDPKIADMWSCGILLYSMLTARLPFASHSDEHTVVMGLLRANLTFPANVALSADAKSLISMLLAVNPERRPTWEKVFAHPFFDVACASSSSSSC